LNIPRSISISRALLNAPLDFVSMQGEICTILIKIPLTYHLRHKQGTQNTCNGHCERDLECARH
jgi:hypothetical protein